MPNHDEQCIFCRIVSGSVPARVIARSDAAVAFLDLEPIAPGHTLVVPTHHSETLADLPTELVGPLFAVVQEAAHLLTTRLGADGMNIGINQGLVGGQRVPHLHVHLLPRFTGDGGGSVHTIVRNPPHETIETIYATITTT